jgi:hypothetical protein
MLTSTIYVMGQSLWLQSKQLVSIDRKEASMLCKMGTLFTFNLVSPTFWIEEGGANGYRCCAEKVEN